MAKTTNKNTALIVVAIAMVAGAVYFIYTQLKPGKKDDEKEDKKDEDVSTGQKDTSADAKAGQVGGEGGQAPAPPSAPSGGGGGPTAAQTELATKYRIWANSTDDLKKKYGKLSKFDLDATSSTPYNSYFLKSYEAGKIDYEKSLSGTSPDASTPWTVSPDQLTDIDTILSGGTWGSKASYQYLFSTLKNNPDYVKNWAMALRFKRTTFLFANQVYDVYEGVRRLDFNPYIVRNWYTKFDGAVKANPTMDSFACAYSKNYKLPKVKSLKYKSGGPDKGLWGYMPELSTMCRWTRMNWISPTPN